MTTRRLGGVLAAAIGLVLMFAIPAQAAAKDRNHDGIRDRWERHHHLSLRVKQGHRDQDRDGLNNMGEFRAGDNPRDVDTDNDGIKDGDENAGTIASFDSSTGHLVIDLFGGDTMSGMVTDQTEIECENENENEDNDNQADSRDGSSEDNSGPGSENSGPGNANDENANCTTADLTPGAAVQEAELQTEGGNAVFEKVELNN